MGWITMWWFSNTLWTLRIRRCWFSFLSHVNLPKGGQWNNLIIGLEKPFFKKKKSIWFGIIGKFWKWVLVMVVQSCECTECHRILHLMMKMATFMSCIFYHSKIISSRCTSCLKNFILILNISLIGHFPRAILCLCRFWIKHFLPFLCI